MKHNDLLQDSIKYQETRITGALNKLSTLSDIPLTEKDYILHYYDQLLETTDTLRAALAQIDKLVTLLLDTFDVPNIDDLPIQIDLFPPTQIK